MKNGSKFGRWTVIRRAEASRSSSLCLCACGTERIVASDNLKSGRSLSCGCLRREKCAHNGRKNRTHGQTGSPTFKSWEAMRERCHNRQHKSYATYGGAGVTICVFLYDCVANVILSIGIRPAGKTLDRIDGDKGYWCGDCPECKRLKRQKNIRWATPTEQAGNRRNNVVVEIDGAKRRAVEWAELAGVSANTFWQRVRRGEAGRSLLAPPHARKSID
jgi:hypothetical protein